MAKLVPRPHALILVCGAPGAGKTTLARALMCRLAGAWLNSDAVIEPHETRLQVTRALAMLRNKRASRPPKKHGNIPL